VDPTPTLPSIPPFAQYGTIDKRYDEYCARDGSVRSAWKPIASFLDPLGAGGLQSRAEEAERLVLESAANMRAQPGRDAPARPWKLSAIPMVLSADTWRTLESGLQQRVRVLEAVLADLLGPKQLIKHRVLPAELLSANPHYSRTYHELPKTSQHRLSLTATDLARDDDGTWWVTGDRTRAPSGLGFALENRIITSRVFPEMIRRSNVHRFAKFFLSLQEHHYSMVTRHRDNPRAAILTPGPRSYRYMEDAYLARYLGYTLVQGRDLAVRQGQLNLKTLGGLLPIDVLWRQVSDPRCDPLELDADSTDGVTGLLTTIRSGTVAVANDIGSILAQTPALLPFLSAAAKFLFDEELELPTVATYWCGGQRERAYVLEHLDRLMIRPAFMITEAPPIVSEQLSVAARQELVAAINANPYQFVAQPRPARSTTPVWHEQRLQPWYVTLRSFQLQAGDSVHVLPGGLARVSPDQESLDQTPTSGRLGQDCWVIGDEPVDTKTTLLPSAGETLRLTRSGDELPSRVAENLFWLGRYVERAEAISRLMRTALTRLVSESDISDQPEMSRLIAVLAAVGQIEPDYAIEELGENMPKLDQVLPDSVFEPASALQSCVVQMLDNASAVRDRISLDAYRILSRIDDELTDNAGVLRDVATTIERMNRLISELLAFAGLVYESMTRTHAWRFLELGRRIERAFQTAELLTNTLVHPIVKEGSLLEPVLRTTDSLMTYRVRYLLQLQSAAAMDLLITDETNPRSIVFQLHRIDRIIGELPTDDREVLLGGDEKLAKSLLNHVQMSDPYDLTQTNIGGKRNELEVLLKRLIDELPRLSDAITARYLIHTSRTQSLTGSADPWTPNKGN
jgi:uncharacterized circularly permuted ATP-grasp superfamily protein/uncharacterized alpha-E superfamily protein